MIALRATGALAALLAAVPGLHVEIIGERDEEPLRGLAQRIAAEAPSARLADMKGVGHMAPMERPAEFNRLLVEFLR
ncbi:MAG: alpha/beta fold hydrolase [Vicinamibacterales bacterium]